jgi:hypothetical protein
MHAVYQKYRRLSMAPHLLQAHAPARSSSVEATMVILTPEDWAEIYYALETKLRTIKTNFYREDRLGDDAAWIEHLNRIKRRIGPDGRRAAGEGVTGK